MSGRYYEVTVEVPYVGSESPYRCKFIAGFPDDYGWIIKHIASETGQSLSVVEPIVKLALLRKHGDAA